MAFENININSAVWPGLKWLLLPTVPRRPWFAPENTSASAPPKARQTPPRRVPPEPSPSRSARSAWRPAPQEDWPDVWRKCFAETRAGRVVWTYWELGEDLYRRPDAHRREFFQRLLKDLNHPGGTHTFFPVCLSNVSQNAHAEESESDFAPNPDVFWSALKKLDARGLVIFGEKALKAAGLGRALHTFDMIRQRGLSVWHLPDVHTASDIRYYGGILEFLRTALHDAARAARQ